MWVHTHYVWDLWEEHGMVHMPVIGQMVQLCQYWMYGCGQDGMFLAYG
jgi:hypothetical protein